MRHKKNQDIEILSDVKLNGKINLWREKKVKNELLQYAYKNINKKKFYRLKDCATYLHYAVTRNEKKLKNANFCRISLCPICSWRRGLKIFAQTKKIMDEVEKDNAFSYIFLTLTVKNCYGGELQTQIDLLMASWQRFVQRKKVNDAIQGWYRGLEITHDTHPLITKTMYFGDCKKIKSRKKYYDKLCLTVGDINPSYNTYHPHFHCVFAVPKEYFGKKYVEQKEWQMLWKESLGVDYEPQVDVRKVKGNTAKAVSEIAKYAVKDSDYIIPDDWDLTVETVALLDKALHKRRLVAYGKLFKTMHKKLNLDDIENGDLVHIDSDEKCEEIDREEFYVWNVGYQEYIRER